MKRFELSEREGKSDWGGERIELKVITKREAKPRLTQKSDKKWNKGNNKMKTKE